MNQPVLGKRLLRRWIMHPLRDLKIIVARQKGIAALVEQPSIRGAFLLDLILI